MNNLEISYMMRVHPYFMGVFAIDTLPQPILPESCFIFNTDSSNLGGRHWIAIKINKENQGFYYDPLGFHPIAGVCNHILGFAHGLSYIETSTQDPHTSLCGQHCIEYLYRGISSKSPNVFMNKIKQIIDN